MREEYIQMRKSAQYNMGWFYNYFMQHPKRTFEVPFKFFIQAFQMYFSFNSESIFEHVDKEFGLTVTTFEGKIINVY
mgnify:CR=1 FL=1